MIEPNKYYIMHDPSTSCGTFKKGDLVWVEAGDKPCSLGNKMLTISHCKQDLVEKKFYCECSAHRFKSLESTWWKKKTSKTHIKIIEFFIPGYLNTIIYYKDKKYSGIVSISDLFESCELETHD